MFLWFVFLIRFCDFHGRIYCISLYCSFNFLLSSYFSNIYNSHRCSLRFRIRLINLPEIIILFIKWLTRWLWRNLNFLILSLHYFFINLILYCLGLFIWLNSLVLSFTYLYIFLFFLLKLVIRYFLSGSWLELTTFTRIIPLNFRNGDWSLRIVFVCLYYWLVLASCGWRNWSIWKYLFRSLKLLNRRIIELL